MKGLSLVKVSILALTLGLIGFLWFFSQMPTVRHEQLKQNTPFRLEPRRSHTLIAVGLPSDGNLSLSIKYLDKQKLIEIDQAFDTEEKYSIEGTIKHQKIISSSLRELLAIEQSQPVEITASWKPENVVLILVSHGDR
jgi:hypothetical protein